MCEEEIDLDEHWSYTIMGNWRANHYFEDLFFICLKYETDKEKSQVLPDSEFIDSIKVLIVRSYDELISFTHQSGKA